MEAMENMINEEMVQDVFDTVVEIQPKTGMMNGFIKNSLVAVAGALAWEGIKFGFKKVSDYRKAKKAAKEESEDFADLEEAEEVETK